ncbi:MAG: PBECR4 domain-containing protein [Butyrivibrio sp.]|nr:PBECR4 domain-containing protein [Butyrivibrio sp.]
MKEQKTFKERVKETVIKNSYSYKKYYVEYEYLLCSKAFVKNEYYIVAAYEDNYLHLTGLHTSLDAATFFEKCYNGTLDETDFDFCKSGQSENEVKGSVRRKINSLSAIMDIFNVDTYVEEDFEKNRIRCALAAGNISTTLGFVVLDKAKAKPMTLLKGNELNLAKAEKLDLVLRRKSGEVKFSEIIIGTSERLLEHRKALSGLLSYELCALMQGMNMDVF